LIPKTIKGVHLFLSESFRVETVKQVWLYLFFIYRKGHMVWPHQSVVRGSVYS